MGFNDCYEIAQKWPQETLERNPLSKVFGRHMIFFKCVKKVEKKMCTAAQVSHWMDTVRMSTGSSWAYLRISTTEPFSPSRFSRRKQPVKKSSSTTSLTRKPSCRIEEGRRYIRVVLLVVTFCQLIDVTDLQ